VDDMEKRSVLDLPCKVCAGCHDLWQIRQVKRLRMQGTICPILVSLMAVTYVQIGLTAERSMKDRLVRYYTCTVVFHQPLHQAVIQKAIYGFLIGVKPKIPTIDS